MTAALVLFSGGQDSTICLAWALARFDRVETVGFDYGQRHVSELAARPRILAALRKDFPAWADKLGKELTDKKELTDAIDAKLKEIIGAFKARFAPPKPKEAAAV